MTINSINSNYFKKSGKEFREVLGDKIRSLQERVDKRNMVLEEVMDDKRKLRSYLLRSAKPLQNHGHRNSSLHWTTSYGKDHIGIEEVEEIKYLCSRIFQIENEIIRLKTLRNNVSDSDEVSLTLQELIQYGFK